MPIGTTIAVAALAVVCAALLVYDVVQGNRRRGTIGLGLLVLFLIILFLTTGFPIPSERRVSFGGGSIAMGWAVLAMAVGVVLGMIGQYFWAKPPSFSWLDFLRPIVVSPLVLLPLIGTLSDQPLEMIQFLSLAMLAFQNGFFWQQVLKDAKPRTS